MIDTLPNKSRLNESAIVNLDTSDRPGTHWVCYVKKGDNVLYFDPFGNLRPQPELLNYLKGNNIKIYYNRTNHQKWGTPYCGHLCLQFLYKYG